MIKKEKGRIWNKKIVIFLYAIEISLYCITTVKVSIWIAYGHMLG